MKKSKILFSVMSVLLTVALLFAMVPAVSASASEVVLMDEDFDDDFVLADFLTSFPTKGETGNYDVTVEENGSEDGSDCFKYADLEYWATNTMVMGFDFNSIDGGVWRSKDITFTFDMKLDKDWSWDRGVELSGRGTLEPWLSSEDWSYGAHAVKLTDSVNQIELGEWQQISITFNVADVLAGKGRETSGRVFLLFRLNITGDRAVQLCDNMKMTYEDDGVVDDLLFEDFNDIDSVPSYLSNTYGDGMGMSIEEEEGMDGTDCFKYITTENWTKFLIMKLNFTGLNWRSEDITVSFDMKAERVDGKQHGTGFMPKLAETGAFGSAVNILEAPIAMNQDEWQKMEITFNIKELYPSTYATADYFNIVFTMDDSMVGWGHSEQWYDNIKVAYATETPTTPTNGELFDSVENWLCKDPQDGDIDVVEYYDGIRDVDITLLLDLKIALLNELAG